MAFHAGRTAIRLSPGLTMLGIDEGAEGPALCRYLVAELDKLGLVYLHIIDGGDLTRHLARLDLVIVEDAICNRVASSSST
jgi:hypothetical protein